MLELNSSFLWIFFLLWLLYFTLNRFFFKPVGRIISERELVPHRAAGYELEDGQLVNQRWVSPSLNTTALSYSFSILIAEMRNSTTMTRIVINAYPSMSHLLNGRISICCLSLQHNSGKHR